MMMKNHSEQLLTVKKLSMETGINPATLWWWVRERKFDVIRCGRKVLIPERSFFRFIEAHRETTHE
jgi:helix-turn-helix protein